MSTTKGKKIIVTIMKSCLHIAIYMFLGLMLALFINSTASAAEPGNTANQYYNVETERGDTGDSYSESSPIFEPMPASTHEPLQPASEPPASDTDGVLLVHNKAEGTLVAISGTVFAVHRTFDNAFIGELTTDMFGEAMMGLPEGDYYLRITAVLVGYILNTDRINFNMQAGLINEVIVLTRPEPVISPPPVQDPGRLVIVNRADGTGEYLSGSIFAVFNAMNDHYIAEGITNHFGEASFELPAGDYYIRQTIAPAGFLPSTGRTGFRIAPGEIRAVNVTNRPQQAQTDTTADEYGRLLVTVRAEGTREAIQGAAFTVHHSLTDEVAARIATDRFGEASANLPAGDYFLRQTSAPSGYILNTDRIAARIQGGAVREITVANRAEPAEAEPEASGQPGRLLVIMRAEVTRELLEGAVFALHESRFDMQVSTLTTDRFGEATITLPAGSYYLRQTGAPDGFALNSDRINLEVKADEVREITVTGRAEPMPETPPDADMGRLLVTARAYGSDDKLQGVTFAVYHGFTDAIAGNMITDQFGEASMQLPAGEYFIRQISSRDGYTYSTDRIPVIIQEGAVREISVSNRALPPPEPAQAPASSSAQSSAATAPASAAPTPTPDAIPEGQGKIEAVTRAAGSGNPLSGGSFAVYRVYDNHRVGEITTGAGGMGYLFAEPGMYFIRELRPTFGYLIETERIFFEVREGGTVMVELTKERDPSIVDLPPDAEGNAFIHITQTGQAMPAAYHMGGGLMAAMAAACGGLALREYISKKKTKKHSDRRALHNG